MNGKRKIELSTFISCMIISVVLVIAAIVILMLYSMKEIYPNTMYNMRTYKHKGVDEVTIMMITDEDKSSKYEDKWYSHFYLGGLTKDPSNDAYSYHQYSVYVVDTKYNESGRGAEFSEIVYFNDHLYTFDDKTGGMFEVFIDSQKIKLIQNFYDGDGSAKKGMKCEWGLVNGDHMRIGSHGDVHYDGEFDYSKAFTQYVDKNLNDKVENWTEKYKILNDVLNVTYPGYITNEAVTYSHQYKQYYFFPRKVSYVAYEEVADTFSASQYVIVCKEDFKSASDCKKYKDPSFNKERTYSSIKLMPYNEKIVIYTKSVEIEGLIESYIGIVSLEDVQEGEEMGVIMAEQRISPYKIEGLEIMPRSWD